MQEASKTFWSCQSHPKQMIQNRSVKCCHTVSAQMNLYLASQLAKPHLFSQLEDAGRSRLGFEYFQNQNKLINYPRTHSHTYYTLHIFTTTCSKVWKILSLFHFQEKLFSFYVPQNCSSLLFDIWYQWQLSSKIFLIMVKIILVLILIKITCDCNSWCCRFLALMIYYQLIYYISIIY